MVFFFSDQTVSTQNVCARLQKGGKMKSKYLIVLCCIGIVLFAPAVYANEPGPYLSIQGGFSYLDDITFSGTGTGGLNLEAQSDMGVGILGAIGYDWGRVRLEGELGYRKNSFDQIATPTGTEGLEGDQDVWSFMVNGAFDIETGSALTPYVLVGLGWAKIDINDFKRASVTRFDTFDDSVFAYQFGVGVGYAVTDSLIFDISYRYFTTSDPEYDDPAGNIEGECSAHNILLGLRFAF